MARHRVATLTPNIDAAESRPPLYDTGVVFGMPADSDSLFGSSPSPSIAADDTAAGQPTPQRSQPAIAPARLPLLQLPPDMHSLLHRMEIDTAEQESIEQNLVLAPGVFWRMILRDKVEKLATKKFQPQGSTIPDDTVVTVSVSDRAERDLVKRYDDLDIEWDDVEEQLKKWSGLFRAGKKLRIDVIFDYKEVGQSGGRSSGRGGRRGRQSVSRRMLEDRDTQLDAEESSTGQPSAWRDVYSLMRCPESSCQPSTHCWRYEGGRKHYKLNTHHLRDLVKFVEGGGILLCQEDVPNSIRQQLYAEAQREARRQSKPTGASPVAGPPINITNVLPSSWPGSAVAVPGPDTTQDLAVGATPTVELDVPGPRDVTLKKYSAWQCSQVQHEELKKEYRKACLVALADGLDLEQLHEDQDAEFLIGKGVKRGIARRFIRDISRWAAQQKNSVAPS